MSDGDDGGTPHQGIDLSNYQAGDRVRAAANGLVVVARGKGWNRGYGSHVVLAHRTPEGDVLYSVYAHLAAGSVTVHAGQFVGAGQTLGRVGMSGRATAPHLHFEVRRAENPAERWEHARPIDPLAFVGARIPTPRVESDWARPYLEWAECASLIRRGEDGDRPPSRADWWRTLAAAAPRSQSALPADPESLYVTLIETGLLAAQPVGDPLAPLEWGEMARDLGRARVRGLRLPATPVGRPARRGQCRTTLGVDSPALDLEALAEGRPGQPSRAVVCLVLADLAAGDRRRGGRTRHPARRTAHAPSQPTAKAPVPRRTS